jgi:hypothetical protein
MKHVQDELAKSQRYHLRQLEDNLQKIRTYEEVIEDLKRRNEEHKAAITEIGVFLESLAQHDGSRIEPVENPFDTIIPVGDVK